MHFGISNETKELHLAMISGSFVASNASNYPNSSSSAGCLLSTDQQMASVCWPLCFCGTSPTALDTMLTMDPYLRIFRVGEIIALIISHRNCMSYDRTTSDEINMTDRPQLGGNNTLLTSLPFPQLSKLRTNFTRKHTYTKQNNCSKNLGTRW